MTAEPRCLFLSLDMVSEYVNAPFFVIGSHRSIVYSLDATNSSQLLPLHVMCLAETGRHHVESRTPGQKEHSMTLRIGEEFND